MLFKKRCYLVFVSLRSDEDEKLNLVAGDKTTSGSPSIASQDSACADKVSGDVPKLNDEDGKLGMAEGDVGEYHMDM